MENWTPTKHQLTWFEELISNLNEKGIWKVPENNSEYQIFHSLKEIHFINGKSDEGHRKVSICFGLCGFKMINRTGKKLDLIDGQNRNSLPEHEI